MNRGERNALIVFFQGGCLCEHLEGVVGCDGCGEIVILNDVINAWSGVNGETLNDVIFAWSDEIRVLSGVTYAQNDATPTSTLVLHNLKTK